MARQSLIATLALALALAPSARADDALSVTAPNKLVGDGRSVATVEVTAGTIATGGKLLPVRDVARVTCTNASALAAVPEHPGVLVPAVTEPTSLACVARFHELEAPFQLAVRPPPPGLYATATAVDVPSTTHEVSLDAFVWDGKVRRAPAALDAAASEGRVEVRGSKLILELAGNAPRLVAIALADGDHLGAAFVPVTGVTTIPVESEPRASVQFWIAGRWFGPIKTKGKRANIPIQVPPGITHGVARSTGRAGYVTDAVTDLKIPSRPRIAALLTAGSLRVGDAATIAIAVAGSDGRPGSPKLPVVASAGRGKLAAPTSLGNGLWSVTYTAPMEAGRDRVTIKIDDARRAGTAELDLEIGAGNVSRIELSVAPGPYEPGAEIAGTARVFDAAGNPVSDTRLSATVGGAALVVTKGDPFTFRGRIPERLPEGEVAVEVSSGDVRERVAVKAGGVAVAGTVTAVVDGREATAELAIRDRFGNLVPEGSFEVSVIGGKLERLERGRGAFRAVVVADPRVSSAQLVVRAGGQVLVEQRVKFEPPAHAFVVGAWASGGWIDNLGVLAGPRGSAGLALRRGVGGVELAVLAGIDSMRFRDTTQVVLGGVMYDAARSVVGLGGVLALRARVRLSRRFGIALGAALVPMRARIEFDAGVQVAETYSEAVIGARAQLHGDVRLGPGRLFVGAAFGRASLSEGVVVGRIDGAAIIGGYEWWFTDFGW